MLKAHYLN